MPRSCAACAIFPASSRPRLALGHVVARQRVRPKEKRAKPADRDADLVGHVANSLELGGAGFGREVVVEVVVQLDAVEARVLRQLQALLEGHLLRVGKRPEVDRLLHVVALPRHRWLCRGGSGRAGGREKRRTGHERRTYRGAPRDGTERTVADVVSRGHGRLLRLREESTRVNILERYQDATRSATSSKNLGNGQFQPYLP